MARSTLPGARRYSHRHEDPENGESENSLQLDESEPVFNFPEMANMHEVEKTERKKEETDPKWRQV